ncbi:hypothetical protein ES703_99160 [subsurface metagenome]
MADNRVIGIVEWLERYEVSSRGREPKPGDDLRAGPLQFVRLKVYGHTQSTGYRRLKSVAGKRTMEVFGFFCKFLEIAANQKSEQRGILLNEKNKPATIEDLAFILDVPVKQVENAVKVLSDEKVGWLTNNTNQYNSIQHNTSIRKSPENPGNSGKSGKVESKFDLFWSAYPKKMGKGAARRAFEKIKPSDDLLQKILSAVEQQSKSEQWLKEDGRYVPNPATWLNQERWDDEPKPKMKDNQDGSNKNNRSNQSFIR